MRYALSFGRAMTAADSRRIALSLEGVEEYSHAGNAESDPDLCSGCTAARLIGCGCEFCPDARHPTARLQPWSAPAGSVKRTLSSPIEVMFARDYLGEFEHLVLLALVRLQDRAYGVTVRQEIERRTNREVSIGAVYATLDRLETKGTLVPRWATHEGAGRTVQTFLSHNSARSPRSQSHTCRPATHDRRSGSPSEHI
jgi:PadR family transcriptional regulator PadR